MDDGERVRTYWYVVENIDYFPYSFPDANQEPDKLRRLLSRDASVKATLDSLDENTRVTKMEKIVQRLKGKRSRMDNRFKGWSVVHNGISTHHSAVEFRPAGAIRYNLFDDSFGAEKAVDVALATDMLMLRDIYDVALIVSGDQDYVPAVKALKDCGKRVVNVAFKTRSGKLLPGGAWRLNMNTDWSLEVEYNNLSSHLNISS